MGEWIADLIADHWAKVVATLAALAFGAWWERRRARRQWREREFMHRLMVSLNSIGERDGTRVLQIRTILEKTLDEVMLNREAVERLTKLAMKTTPEQSIIPIPRNDRWYYLNSVLNEIAEATCAGTLAKELGAPVLTDTFLICLTNERDGILRTQKIRAMVVSKNKLLAGAFEDLALESPNHVKRLETLREMRATYERDDDGRANFLEIEIAVPAPHSGDANTD